MGQEITHNKIHTRREDPRLLIDQIDLVVIIVDKKDTLLESVQVNTIKFCLKNKYI